MFPLEVEGGDAVRLTSGLGAGLAAVAAVQGKANVLVGDNISVSLGSIGLTPFVFAPIYVILNSFDQLLTLVGSEMLIIGDA